MSFEASWPGRRRLAARLQGDPTTGLERRLPRFDGKIRGRSAHKCKGRVGVHRGSGADVDPAVAHIRLRRHRGTRDCHKKNHCCEDRAKDKITAYPTPRLLRVPVQQLTFADHNVPLAQRNEAKETIAAPYRSGCEPVHRFLKFCLKGWSLLAPLALGPGEPDHVGRMLGESDVGARGLRGLLTGLDL